MQQFLQLELNEVNFDYVQAYGKQRYLPTLNGMIDRHGLIETSSEKDYINLEPWIQWPTVHTGLAFEDHKLFRLGDVARRNELLQIWEQLEDRGIKVAAISPMNASNKCKAPAIFLPDPWTRTTVSGSADIHRLYRAISVLVNENATGNNKIIKNLPPLVEGLIRFGRPDNYIKYLKLTVLAKKREWYRALILDMLLADLFMNQVRNKTVDYATLFLNAAAHIQHHYMFGSPHYDGPHVNPDWYLAEGKDPLLDVYQLYDSIVARVRRTFPKARIVVVTGLSQDPYPKITYFWRLKNHAVFLRKLGVEFVSVEPRMSRDFTINFENEAAAHAGAVALTEISTQSSEPIFEIDNRGDSLFVELIYDKDVTSDVCWKTRTGRSGLLADEVAFVALKNGHHNGTGYVIDTNRSKGQREASIPLSDIHSETLAHFRCAS